MPMAAYFNPTAYGDLTGANRRVWVLSHIFADQKFMTVFSLLFGAGIILLTTRLEERGQSAWRVHYRRNFWLLVFGLAHAYLFWSGDILVLYALCAAVVFWFRRLSPGWLIVVGLMSLAVPSAMVWFGGSTLAYWPPEIYDEMLADWRPNAMAIQEELAAYRGGWLAQMAARIPHSLESQTYALLFWGFWRAGGLMLVGMALFKWGVVTAKRSPRFYGVMVIVGLIVGLSAVAYGVLQKFWPRLGHGLFALWSRLSVQLLG